MKKLQELWEILSISGTMSWLYRELSDQKGRRCGILLDFIFKPLLLCIFNIKLVNLK